MMKNSVSSYQILKKEREKSSIDDGADFGADRNFCVLKAF
jgi:hypothetical protein